MSRSKDISSLYKFVAVSPGSATYEPTRAVIATTSGTIDIVDADGNAVSAVPVVAGINPFQVVQITAASGSLGLFLGY